MNPLNPGQHRTTSSVDSDMEVEPDEGTSQTGKEGTWAESSTRT